MPGGMVGLTPALVSVVRMVLGLIMLQYGMMKLFSFPASISHGQPLSALLYTSALIEFFGGMLLCVGLLTRSVAFLMAGEMAFAYFLFHFPKGAWPVLNGGNLPVVLCFALLFVSSAGAGPWSVDALWRRTKKMMPGAGLRHPGAWLSSPALYWADAWLAATTSFCSDGRKVK
jgi:putative oxidoreductase